MKLRSILLTAVLGAAGWLLVGQPAPALADHYDRYTSDRYASDRYASDRYYRGRDSYEIRSREILHSRLVNLADRVRLAERERAIRPNTARHFHEDLDDVQDFLVHDRYLSQHEFERRMDDLDNVDRELRDSSGSRYARYYRSYDRGTYRYR